MRLTRRTLVWAVAAAIAACSGAFAAAHSGSQTAPRPDDVTRIAAGAVIDREIGGGQRHEYQIALADEQYARVICEHGGGIDLAARVLAADGAVLIEAASDQRAGREVLEFTSEKAATYRVQIETRYANASSGRYQLRVDEVRTRRDRDRLSYEARSQAFDALTLYRSAEYDRARKSGERALDIRERLLGPDHPDVAASLHVLGLIHAATSDYGGAARLYRRALAINEQALGRDDPVVAEVLDSLAVNDCAEAKYADAERGARQALGLRTRTFGADDPAVAGSLGTLVDLFVAKRDFRTAQGFADRALAIAGKTYGPDDLRYADFASRSSRVLIGLGEYARAEHLEVQALAIRETLAGSESRAAADSLYALGFLYVTTSDNVKSEQMYRRALRIKERLLGPDHLDVGLILHGLGLIAYRRGDYGQAEALYRRSMAIKERTIGPSHPQIAGTVNNLGLVYWKEGDYVRAAELFRRTLAIGEQAYGPDGLDLAPPLANLGMIAKESGDYSGGEAYYKRALAIRERQLGSLHAEVARTVESLGILYRDKGEYASAEAMLLRALDITRRSLGPDHPDVARHLRNLAHLYSAQGDVPNALASLQRASAVEETNLPLNLAVGSERQKLAYFDPFTGTLEKIISFHVRLDPRDGEARDLAVTTLLQRKGRVLDAMADSRHALRRRSNEDDLQVLDRLDAVTSRLAALVLNGPQRASLAEHQEHIAVLTAQRDTLESEANRRSAGYFERTDPVTLAAIREAIPADAALVEFAVFRPYDPKAPVESPNGFEEPRYVAYIIRHRGDEAWTDLGPAEAIDKAVDAFRGALRDPKQRDVARLARALDEKVGQPIRASIGDATHWLVSPDGQLDLIPFEALVDENGRYLVERYSITYVTAGRDLLRMQIRRDARSAPVIVADPLFGAPAATHAQEERAPRPRAAAAPVRRSITEGSDRSTMYFAPLGGTLREARTLKSLFPDATVLTGPAATADALRQLDAPRVLHIATHGFFLQNESIANPLLRSGLALGGANLSGGSHGNGILTALEASSLSLWGTKLVTLSACDTGVGEVRNGEGVFGLRRAFFLAGAETLVMSLWPVSDYVTREMMTAYYGGLKDGRGEALRQAQLAMLRRGIRKHPFYWASFIQAGEWANLDERR